MRLAQALEVCVIEQVAFNLRLSHDLRRARRSIDKRHLPKGHPGAEGGQTLAPALFQRDKNTHPAPSQKKYFARLVPGLNDDLGLMVSLALQERPKGFQFGRAEVGTEFELIA